MLILLPPSEGKTAPSAGPILDFSTLAYPQLTQARHQVMSELLDIVDSPDALSILGVSERMRNVVEHQRNIMTFPCAPAREIYTGVLYNAARLQKGDNVAIFSGLFGVTTGEDVIPDYRLSMSVKLPRIGNLKTFWRSQLKGMDLTENLSSLSASDDLYVDMRSGPYQVWNPPGECWTVSVVNPQGKVISHMAKYYRGLLTRALLDSQSTDVADVARSLGEVSVQKKENKRQLTIKIPQL